MGVWRTVVLTHNTHTLVISIRRKEGVVLRPPFNSNIRTPEHHKVRSDSLRAPDILRQLTLANKVVDGKNRLLVLFSGLKYTTHHK